MPEPAPLLLLDLPWLLYRSFFALPSSITDEEGRPVNALLGAVNAVLSLIEARLAARGPRRVVACTGAEQADYRVALYAGYHAHRDPMPDALAAQFERAPQLLDALGWTVSASEALEADDVMFSLARVEEAHGGRALLLTADRDLFGAVSERVAVLRPRKGAAAEQIGPAQVRDLYGVEPQLVPDLIALRGDPSDGLPGAPGIGAKTAAALLRQHGSLEAVLEAAREQAARPAARGRDAIAPRAALALRENAELLLTFKQIATLQRIRMRRPADRASDFAAGARQARRMGMRGLAGRLQELARART